MTETVLFELPQGTYIENSPVVINTGVLYRNNETNGVFACLEFQSTKKAVSSVKVAITPFDSNGVRISDSIIVTYSKLKTTETVKTSFGSNEQINLPNKSTASFTVSVLEVIFFDETKWTSSEEDWREPIVWVPTNTNTSNMQSEQSAISNVLMMIAGATYVVGFIAGLVVGTSVGYYGFAFMPALIVWIVAFVQGSLILGFAEVVKLLNEINIKCARIEK